MLQSPYTADKQLSTRRLSDADWSCHRHALHVTTCCVTISWLHTRWSSYCWMLQVADHVGFLFSLASNRTKIPILGFINQVLRSCARSCCAFLIHNHLLSTSLVQYGCALDHASRITPSNSSYSSSPPSSPILSFIGEPLYVFSHHNNSSYRLWRFGHCVSSFFRLQLLVILFQVKIAISLRVGKVIQGQCSSF